MARVLTTAAGGDIGIGALQSIHRAGHDTVAVDIDPRAAGLYFADDGVTVPRATRATWPTVMAETVESYDVDVVIPLIDPEVARVDELRRALPADVPVLLPRYGLVEKCIDKKSMYDYLDELGIETPDTLAIDSEGESYQIPSSGFPAIVKPRRGQGAEGVRRVTNRAALREAVERSEYEPHELLVQEYISGEEYTSNVASTQDGRLLSVVNKRVPERDGYTAWGVTVEEQSVYDSCVNVFKCVDPRGPMNVQHIMDDDGVPRVIEINPRFSGSSCLTVEAGVNEFDMLIRDALGEQVQAVDEYETGVNIVRYTDQAYIRDDELLDSHE